MKGRIHFGSLEDAANYTNDSDMVDKESLSHGTSLKELEATTRPEVIEHTPLQAMYLSELEEKHRANRLPIPTDDGQVRQWLRLIAHPITIFGEGPYERRERLRHLLATTPSFLRKLTAVAQETKNDLVSQQVADDEEFYVPGMPEFIQIRQWLTEYSLEQSHKRLLAERQRRSIDTQQLMAHRQEQVSKAKSIQLFASQMASERPLSAGSFSHNRQWIGTGDFGGECQIWHADSCLPYSRASPPEDKIVHIARIGSLVFAPSDDMFASCDAEGGVALWQLQPTQSPLLRQLRGHTARVGRCAFHPSGRFLGTASFDFSWRLWDLERGLELQLQEGHSRGVYSIAFHSDGALAATGGLDAHGRIWDLRSGKTIWTLQGHQKGILDIDFHPMLPTIATASEDGTVKLWDLRKLQPSWTIPAHSSVVSSCKWSPDGSMLISSGFEGLVKVWSAYDDHRLLNTLVGHEGKVMACDITTCITPDDPLILHDHQILSMGSDRTFKLWK